MKSWYGFVGLFFAALLLKTGFPLLGEEPSLPERGICSHRGDQAHFPENTLPAFQEAVRLHAAMIEFDVRYTKDQKMVILHDESVDRTSNGTGRIYDLMFDSVRALDFGSWKGDAFAGTQIPTLDEVFAVIPHHIWLNIHCYVPREYEESLGLEIAEKIIAEGREDEAFLACSNHMADTVHQKYPQIKICNMDRAGGNTEKYIENAISRKADFIQLQLSAGMPTADQIDRLKKAGVRVNCFGTNDPDEIRALFKVGVDFPLVDNLPLGQKIFEECFPESSTMNP